MNIVFVGNSSSYITAIIYNFLKCYCNQSPEYKITLKIDTARRGLKYMLMKQDRITSRLRELALRKYNIPLRYFGGYTGEKLDINKIDLSGTDFIFSVGALVKFSKEVTDNYYCVNYHNSLLPECRGFYSTSWSVYRGDKYTGYTWHRMTPNFDDGAILARGVIVVREVKAYSDIVKLDIEKAQMACWDIYSILHKVCPEIPQEGQASYYGQKDLDNLPVNERTLVCFGWNKSIDSYVPRIFRRLVR